VTAGGTPVLELSADEHARFLDDETQRRLGLSAKEFERQFLAGDLDDSDPDVGFLWRWSPSARRSQDR